MSFAQQLASQLSTLPYSALFRETLRTNREALSDGVGIDRLLTFARTNYQLYPPSSAEELNTLIGTIEQNGSSRLTQTRAIYYLFLDFSPPTKDPPTSSNTSAAQYYANQLQLNENEQSFVRSVWFLDHNQADLALKGLSGDWTVESPELINEYIVYALSAQSPRMLVAFLAARGSPGEFVPELVDSLARRGKFHEVLTISRNFQTPQFLEKLAPYAVEAKPQALELAQLPCTHDEWQYVVNGLNKMENPLTDTIQLVRALHLGDNDFLTEFKGVANSDLFIKKVLPSQ